jgi:hypothetical protein
MEQITRELIERHVERLRQFRADDVLRLGEHLAEAERYEASIANIDTEVAALTTDIFRSFSFGTMGQTTRNVIGRSLERLREFRADDVLRLGEHLADAERYEASIADNDTQIATLTADLEESELEQLESDLEQLFGDFRSFFFVPPFWGPEAAPTVILTRPCEHTVGGNQDGFDCCRDS